MCTALTISNSALGLQNAFICFVWFSQWTAIVSLNSIRQVVFVIEIFCFRRLTEFLNFIQMSLTNKFFDVDC
jgi:hypothetical protein